jgi:hypothetical protein
VSCWALPSYVCLRGLEELLGSTLLHLYTSMYQHATCVSCLFSVQRTANASLHHYVPTSLACMHATQHKAAARLRNRKRKRAWPIGPSSNRETIYNSFPVSSFKFKSKFNNSNSNLNYHKRNLGLEHTSPPKQVVI